MVLTLTEDIFIQSKLGKEDKSDISEIRIHNLSDFEVKISQHDKFWCKGFTTRQFFNSKFLTYRLLKKFLHSKTHVLVHFTQWKQHILDIQCFLEEHDFWLKFWLRVRLRIQKTQRVKFWNTKNITRHFLNLKKTTRLNLSYQSYNLSDSKYFIRTRVTFSIDRFTTCQILNDFLNRRQTLKREFHKVSDSK